MHNDPNTLTDAFSLLDEAAPLMHGGKTPHWDLSRASWGYQVIVYLPEHFAGLDDAVSVPASGDPDRLVVWIKTTEPTALEAVNAALDSLRRATAAVNAVAA